MFVVQFENITCHWEFSAHHVGLRLVWDLQMRFSHFAFLGFEMWRDFFFLYFLNLFFPCLSIIYNLYRYIFFNFFFPCLSIIYHLYRIFFSFFFLNFFYPCLSINDKCLISLQCLNTLHLIFLIFVSIFDVNLYDINLFNKNK